MDLLQARQFGIAKAPLLTRTLRGCRVRHIFSASASEMPADGFRRRGPVILTYALRRSNHSQYFLVAYGSSFHKLGVVGV
jgi:hypothetical protein